MQIDVLSHDTETYVARIRFTHKDVVVEDTYNLLLVEPTMKSALALAQTAFSVDMQNKVINTLAGWIESSIENGGLSNMPSPPPLEAVPAL